MRYLQDMSIVAFRGCHCIYLESSGAPADCIPFSLHTENVEIQNSSFIITKARGNSLVRELCQTCQFLTHQFYFPPKSSLDHPNPRKVCIYRGNPLIQVTASYLVVQKKREGKKTRLPTVKVTPPPWGGCRSDIRDQEHLVDLLLCSPGKRRVVCAPLHQFQLVRLYCQKYFLKIS